MPLDRNNRILVQEGLNRLRSRAATTGLMALARVAGCRLDEISARHLGYQIAPRLNAAGRIDDMAVGIRCLVTDDPAEALTLAGELDRLNRERRELEARMREQAVSAVRNLRIAEGQLPPGLTLFDPGWHAGRRGPRGLAHEGSPAPAGRRVRARLRGRTSRFRAFGRGRCTCAIRSRRSRPATRNSSTALAGHAMAAGLTLKRSALARFADAFADEVGRRLTPAQMQNVLETDGELSAAELTLDNGPGDRVRRSLGPGISRSRCSTMNSRSRTCAIVGDRHLKLWLRLDPASHPIEAIAFGYFDEDGAKRPDGRRARPARVPPAVHEFRRTPRAELLAEHVEWRA